MGNRQETQAWIKAPLRAGKEALRTARRVTQQELMSTARTVYRALPLSPAGKRQLKDLLFSSTGSLLS